MHRPVVAVLIAVSLAGVLCGCGELVDDVGTTDATDATDATDTTDATDDDDAAADDSGNVSEVPIPNDDGATPVEDEAPADDIEATEDDAPADDIPISGDEVPGEPDDSTVDEGADGTGPTTDPDAATDAATDEPATPDAPEGGSTTAPNADPRVTIRYATYNVRTSNLNNSAWGDTHVGFDDNDAARMRKVATTIAEQDLTVVSLQETRRAEHAAIVQHLRDSAGTRWGVTSQVRGADDCVVIFDLGVWRKIRETHFEIPLQPGRSDRSQIGVLLEHKATGERIWFYSIHLAAHAEGEAARRTGMRRTIQNLREHPIARGQRFVLGGDFNSVASGAVGDILRNANIATYSRTAADRRVQDGCRSHNSRAGSGGLQSCPGGAASHIDQVWVSRGDFRVLRHAVTATARTSRASDHNPITTILRTR